MKRNTESTRVFKVLGDIIISIYKENKAPIIPLDTPTPTGTHMTVPLQGHEVILGLHSTEWPGRQKSMTWSNWCQAKGKVQP